MVFLKRLSITALLALAGLGLSIPLPAQTREISGRVLDETDLGVPGAYVQFKGGTGGAMTDLDGRFSIKA
ncbi:MAG: hypothetical protein J6X82_00470, partial [Bacteroidales bacterium]|nr:hypothetical protein [Bacteroidales bacterium]